MGLVGLGMNLDKRNQRQITVIFHLSGQKKEMISYKAGGLDGN